MRPFDNMFDQANYGLSILKQQYNPQRQGVSGPAGSQLDREDDSEDDEEEEEEGEGGVKKKKDKKLVFLSRSVL